MAHDLRQPVTTIFGYSALLAKRAENYAPDQIKDLAGHIHESARRLDRMICDLLDVSRIEARRLTIEHRLVDLTSLVRAFIAREAETTVRHVVRLEVKGRIPRLSADPMRVDQMLGNLLSNAAKYSYPGSEIVVTLERHDGEVEVTVMNHGPGISPENLHHLFSRFFRAREMRAGAVPGLGLGLYITRGLVEAHGGQIWAESIPGRTTCFHFTLPLAPRQPRGVRPSPGEQ